jgi:hypothetical protein
VVTGRGVFRRLGKANDVHDQAPGRNTIRPRDEPTTAA